MTQITIPQTLTIVPDDTAFIIARINRKDFLGQLLFLRGATPISFVCVLEPDMKKTDNPFYIKAEKAFTIVKIARVNGMVNFQYDAGVLRRLSKEGKSPDDFRRGGSYHTAVLSEDDKLTPLCIHKVDAALVVGWHPRHRDIIDGRPVGDDKKAIPLADCQVNPFHAADIARIDSGRYYLRFMYLRSETEFRRLADNSLVNKDEVTPWLNDKSTYDNQGLDSPLIFQTYGVDTLRQAYFDKRGFTITDL